MISPRLHISHFISLSPFFFWSHCVLPCPLLTRDWTHVPYIESVASNPWTLLKFKCLLYLFELEVCDARDAGKSKWISRRWLLGWAAHCICFWLRFGWRRNVLHVAERKKAPSPGQKGSHSLYVHNIWLLQYNSLHVNTNLKVHWALSCNKIISAFSVGFHIEFTLRWESSGLSLTTDWRA